MVVSVVTDNSPARVRFAPSPTGHLHVGGARTALFNYLLARQTGGQFILRIEDTDRQRFVSDAQQDVMESLRWLGLQWDEGPDVSGPAGPYIQSERVHIYRHHAEQLVDQGQAYYCFCSKERLTTLRSGKHGSKGYDGHCRTIPLEQGKLRRQNGEPCVVRFRMPRSSVTSVKDVLRGEIKFDNTQLEDFVLLKTDGIAVYHLAAMVDDHLMHVTHVIRGDEWLSSLPKHALMLRAFGWQEPVWCHISILKKPDGSGKMSKRDESGLNQTASRSIFIRDLQRAGYLPAAMVNWMALMGWSYNDSKDDFTLSELAEVFSLKRLTPSAASVSFERLDHFQGKYMRQLPAVAVAQGIKPVLESHGLHTDKETLLKIVPLIQERILTFGSALQWAGFFFSKEVNPAPEDLVHPETTPQQSRDALKAARGVLAAIPEFDRETTHSALRSLADELQIKPGQLFLSVRVAVSGQRISPPLFEVMEILGRETVLDRIGHGEQLLATR